MTERMSFVANVPLGPDGTAERLKLRLRGDEIPPLTKIVRAEPEASLFTVPPNFKVVAGPPPIVYRTN